MTVYSISFGTTGVQVIARARAKVTPPEVLEVPGGLYPLMSSAWEVDEYRVLSGWPVPIPDLDIQVNVLCVADGTSLGNRDYPTALITNADMRWVADDNYYDPISMQWTPIQGGVTPWVGSTSNAPTLIDDYEYRIGDERFVGMTALNFDSDTGDYLSNNLDLVMGGTEGYTVIMVLNPNSIYGNDQTVIENALWGSQDTDGAWVAFTVRDQAVWMTTESLPAQKGVAIGNALSDTAPTYLALVVRRPQTTLYAAPGPSNVKSVSLAAGSAAEPLSARFWLGNAALSTAAPGTMDMALLDLGIYANPLAKKDVVSEFALLSQVYGGDS